MVSVRVARLNAKDETDPPPWVLYAVQSEFLLISLVAAASACDAASSKPAKAEPPAPAIRVAEVDQPDSTVVANPAAVPMEVSLVAVRTKDDVVEIEVALPQALPSMSGVRPSLEIGGETTNRSRPGPHGRLDRLVFLVPAEQYARMSKDAELIVRAGLFTNETVSAKPRLREAE